MWICISSFVIKLIGQFRHTVLFHLTVSHEHTCLTDLVFFTRTHITVKGETKYKARRNILSLEVVMRTTGVNFFW